MEKKKMSERLAALTLTVAKLEMLGARYMNIGAEYIFAEECEPEFFMPFVQVFAAEDVVKMCAAVRALGEPIHDRRSDKGKPIHCYRTDNNVIVEVWE